MGDISDDSTEEEDVIRNFDDEARIIVQMDTLPLKSSDRYELLYKTYQDWKKENHASLSNNEENNLLVYFKILKGKVKPTTMWSVWSMLRKTLGTKENINIKNFISLKSFIKNANKGYVPQKAFVLKWHQIIKFINEAPDSIDLAKKVIILSNKDFDLTIFQLIIITTITILTGYTHFWNMWLLKMR